MEWKVGNLEPIAFENIEGFSSLRGFETLNQAAQNEKPKHFGINKPRNFETLNIFHSSICFEFPKCF